METCLDLPWAEVPTPSPPSRARHHSRAGHSVRRSGAGAELRGTRPCALSPRSRRGGPGTGPRDTERRRHTREKRADRQGARGGIKHPPPTPPAAPRRGDRPPRRRNRRAVSPPRAAISPHAFDGGNNTQESGLPSLLGPVEAAAPARHPRPPGATPAPSPSLSAMAGRQAGGIPGSSVAGGAGRLRELALRARPLLFPAAPAWGRLAHLRANTGQSERTEPWGGRGSRFHSLSRRTESLSAGGPRRGPLPCPHTVGSRLPSIARAQSWWECARRVTWEV